MTVSRMTIRGHEHFVEPPVAVTTGLGRSNPRVSVFDQQRIALAQLREQEAARIKNEEELLADLLDFSDLTEVDDYGLPISTPYAVPEEVPDMYISQNVQNEEKKNSVSTEGSGTEPSGGTE